MEKKSYNVSDIYQGGYSSLKPNYGNFTGYRASAGSLGTTTDPRTANILQEVSAKLSSGLKQIEISAIRPELFDSIPKQQLKEVNRLSKLTGVDISVHGPLIEASGIGREGGYSDVAREEAERQLTYAVERSHEISPDGNVPVTFHSSVNVQGPHYRKTEKGEEIEMMPIINKETGQMNMVKKEVKHHPGMKPKELEEGRTYDVRKQLDVIGIKERADNMIHESQPLVKDVLPLLESNRISFNDLDYRQQEALSRYKNASEELQDIRKHLAGLFDKAWKYNPEEREHLREISESFRKELSKADTLQQQSRVIQNLMEQLRPEAGFITAPQQYQSVNEFALDKTAETFGNVAFKSYKKFKDKAPIVSIENPPAGGGLSRGEDLRNVVEKARKQFIKVATEEGMPKSEAEKQAEKLIGVTWDVGHINMIRKYGFEEKDVVKETEKIAPYLKHVHLSDNFGFEHTELPMGMGNVPLKEMMERLGEKGFEAKKVIEAAAWWEHFKGSPTQESFEAFGSPIYAMKNAPYWNQSIGLQQGYFSGYGQMLPSTNYETFGAGFSQLPQELGGQKPGGSGGSRLSGRPLE